MRTASSVLIVLLTFNLAAIAHGQARRTGKAGTATSKAATVAKSENEIPKVEIKTVDVPDTIEWGFMLWTDASGKHQVRGKVLSIDGNGKQVRLEKEGGAILNVAIDKFCAADRELLTAAYDAQSEIQSEPADGEKLRKDVERVFEVPATETSLRKDSIQKTQQEAFLKSYNGKDICLRFPIEDIQPARGLSRGRRMMGGGEVIQGRYQLQLGKEAVYGLTVLGRFGEVRLSASEAESVAKGDCLTLRGKAKFSFEYAPFTGVSFSFPGYNLTPSLVLEKPEFAIVRSKHDSSLNDKIKARAAELKAIEANEEEAKKAAQRRKENPNPFNDK